MNLKFKIYNLKFQKGFSMTELLVVLALIAILAGSMVFYSRSIERQIIIFKEQIKIVSAIQKAKSLGLVAFLKTAQAPCGYGVHFSMPDSIIIFKEISLSGDTKCLDTDAIYTSPDENFEEIKLDKTIKFTELGLNDIVFIPPEPIIIIDGQIFKNEALIKIKTIDNKGEKIIKVTNAGQITTQ